MKKIQAEEWMDQAACIGEDQEMFFSTHPGPQMMAKQICQRCPVISECLSDALEREERLGVWGGTTPAERRRLLVHAV